MLPDRSCLDIMNVTRPQCGDTGFVTTTAVDRNSSTPSKATTWHCNASCTRHITHRCTTVQLFDMQRSSNAANGLSQTNSEIKEHWPRGVAVSPPAGNCRGFPDGHRLSEISNWKCNVNIQSIGYKSLCVGLPDITITVIDDWHHFGTLFGSNHSDW